MPLSGRGDILGRLAHRQQRSVTERGRHVGARGCQLCLWWAGYHQRMRAAQYTDVIAFHGEGCTWWESLTALRCLDMLAGDVLTVYGDGRVERTPVGSPIAAMIRPRRQGGALVARATDLAIADHDDLSDLRPLATVLTESDVRLNEGGCDPQGRCYIGSMAYDHIEGAASLYRCASTSGDDAESSESSEPEVVQLLRGLTISAGLGWSPDGRTAYHVDNPTRVITAYDHDPDTGLIPTSGRVVARIEGVGHPDGLTVDREGGVWVALYGGWAVHRYDAKGALSAQVHLPAAQVTSCTFGGPDLATLFITTSRENLDDAELADQPAAGALFAVQPGVAGLPALPYAG